ncbi:MAG TPA: preprotein translocase subunit SecE [Dehalococcoidia bacterium]|nr:preprotein translocase subunit SecE [Dehalococcoidia bacterium]
MSRAVKRQTAKGRRKGPAPAPKIAAARPAARGGRLAGAAGWRPRFVTDIVSELRKVTWPTRDETIHLTVVVLVVALLMGALLGGLDAGFGWFVDRTLLDRNLFDNFFG